jgi:hypothetical protein
VNVTATAPSARARRLSPAQAWLAGVSLEELLVHPLLVGLTTATPLQRAICRAAEGRHLAELWGDPDVREGFGGTLPRVRPDEFAIVAGIRTYKSGLAACAGIQASQQCDVTGLRPGEICRVSIVSTKLDNAKAVYRHLAGAFKASPVLREVLLSDPDNSEDRFMVRHPSGVPVEIATVAGSRAGAALVSVWQAAVIFDEYARMTGDASEGGINWTDQRKAVAHRIRPGGYLWHITSPTGPMGPAFDHVSKHLGMPSKRLCVVRAKAPAMNPHYWTPERCEAARERDEDSYLTDVLAQFGSGDTQFFHATPLDACLRPTADDLPRDPLASYTAAMDPATRGNGWTFGIFSRDGRTRQLVAAREWLGSRAAPLDPRVILRDEIAPLCRAYGVSSIDTDGWSGDALASIAREHDLELVAYDYTAKRQLERYMHVRTMLIGGEVSLPAVPAIRADLLRVKRRPTNTGATIHLPLTSDGRHCDWAPTIVQGLCTYLDDLADPPPDEHDHDAWARREAARMRAQAERSMHGDDDE